MASDDRIDVEITDKISPAVAKKLLKIALDARKADTYVKSLKKSLSSLNVQPFNKLAAAQAKTALGQQRVRTEIERTTAARQRAISATKRAEISALRLSTAKDKLARAGKRVRSSISQTASSLGSFLTLAKAYIALRMAQAVLRLADSFTLLQNKLKNVARNQEELNVLTEEIFNVARETRTSVTTTAQAFQRFDLALKRTGASQAETIRLTKTLNKLLLLSGATTMEQSSALLQLSQAFNEGRLRGQEFRIISQTMPAVLNKIAESAGVSRGALKKMAADGRLDINLLRTAIAGLASETDKRFAKIVPTLAQSFVVLKDRAILAIGEISKSFGVTKALSTAVLALADNLDAVGAFLATFTLTAFLGPFAPLLSAAVAALVIFKDEIKLTKDGIVSLGDFAKSLFSFLQDGFKSVAKSAIDFFKKLDFSRLKQSIIKNLISIGLFLKKWINNSISLFLAFYNSIIKTWDLLPAVFKDIINIARNAVIDSVEKMVNGVIKAWNTLPSKLFSILKGIGTLVYKSFKNQVKFITDTWNKLPAFFDNVVTRIGNFIINGFTKSVTESIRLLNKLPGIAIDIEDKVNKTIQKADFVIPAAKKLNFNPLNFEIKETDLTSFKGKVTGAAKDASGIIQGEFKKAFDTDFVGNAFDKVLSRARKIAEARQSKGVNILRPAGPAPVEIDPKVAKAAAKRADAIARVNRNLDAQIGLLGKLKAEREIQEQFSRIENQLLSKKIVLTETEKQSILDKIKTIQEEKNLQQELDDILRTSGEERIKLLQERYNRINELRRRDLISEKQAAQAKTRLWVKEQNIRLQDSAMFFSTLSGLQSSSNKEAARIGKAAAITSAIISTYQAANKALATSGNYYLGVANAAAAVAVGLSNVDRIRNTGNYQEGGVVPGTSFSGDNVTANVNSGEMILNRSQQAQLFNMAKGSATQTSDRKRAVELKVNVENYGPSEIEVQQLSETEVRVIAHDVAKKTVRDESPNVIASDIQNPNGRVSRSLARNTNIQRKR